MPSIDAVTGSGAWAPSPMSYNIVMSGASFHYQIISQCYALTHTNTLSSTLPGIRRVFASVLLRTSWHC